MASWGSVIKCINCGKNEVVVPDQFCSEECLNEWTEKQERIPKPVKEFKPNKKLMLIGIVVAISATFFYLIYSNIIKL